MSGGYVELDAFKWWQKEVRDLADMVATLSAEVASLRRDTGSETDEIHMAPDWRLMHRAGERLAERVRTISRATGGAPEGPVLDWLCPPPKLDQFGRPVSVDDACRLSTRCYAEEFLYKWKVMGKAT